MKTKNEIKDSIYKKNVIDDVISFGFKIIIFILVVFGVVKKHYSGFLSNLSIEDFIFSIVAIMLTFIFVVRYVVNHFSRFKKLRSLKKELRSLNRRLEIYMKNNTSKFSYKEVEEYKKKIKLLNQKIISLEAHIEMLQ